jgi:hypothetical protein
VLGWARELLDPPTPPAQPMSVSDAASTR